MDLDQGQGCGRSPLTAACAALTSELLPVPRAPHNSTLLAGSPAAKRRVLSIRMSRTRSMPAQQVELDAVDLRQPARATALRMPHKGVGGVEVDLAAAAAERGVRAHRRCAAARGADRGRSSAGNGSGTSGAKGRGRYHRACAAGNLRNTRPLLFNQASRTNPLSCGWRSPPPANARSRGVAAHDLEVRCRC